MKRSGTDGGGNCQTENGLLMVAIATAQRFLTPLCSEQKTHPICSERLIILRKQKGGCCLNTHPSKLSEFIGTLIKWGKYGLYCYLARKILRPA